jgi:hypothetical protein
LPIAADRCGQLATSRVSIPAGDYAPILRTDILNRLASDGPMLVDMKIGQDFFTLGHHAVYQPAGAGTLLHSMCLVGYRGDVAIVLNSMGAAWGNQGYANIRIGTGELLERFPYIVPVV